MYQHFNTRRRFALRIVSYVFMTLAVIVGVFGMTAWIMGYRLDLQKQEVSQVALLQMGSWPSGARIYLNGDLQSFNTPGRHEMGDGKTSVRYSLNGYRDWTNEVALRPAEIRWLNYARLVPNEIKTESVFDLGTVHDFKVSPDKKWLFVQPNPSSRTFKIVEIANLKDIKMKDFTIDVSALSEPTGDLIDESFRLIEWNSKSEFVLLERTINGTKEIIRVDRRDAEKSVNLSSQHSLAIDDPHMLFDNADIIYGLVGGNLRRFDIGAKTVSEPLIVGVEKYRIYSDGKVAYVTGLDSATDTQTIGVYFRERNYKIKTVTNDQPILAEFSHYYDDYISIVHGAEIFVIKNPFDEKPKTVKTFELDQKAAWLNVSANGRFILVGYGNKIRTYDIEHDELFTFDTGNFVGQPKWLDDFHLTYNDDGNFKIVDFDGRNAQKIVSANRVVMLSPNQRHFVTIKSDENGSHLQLSNMVIN